MSFCSSCNTVWGNKDAMKLYFQIALDLQYHFLTNMMKSKFFFTNIKSHERNCIFTSSLNNYDSFIIIVGDNTSLFADKMR